MAEENLTPDQRRARTRMQKDPDFYKKIGSKGGKNNKTKFNSESARVAVEARWAKKRAKQSQKGKNDEHSSEAT